MGKGGYNGGSTILREGRKWFYDPDFDVVYRHKDGGGDDLLYLSYKREREERSTPPKLVVCGREISSRALNKHRTANAQHLDRDVILAALGRPLSANQAARQIELKRLVVAKILLRTGVINVGHPQVAAWLKKNGKNKKSNV